MSLDDRRHILNSNLIWDSKDKHLSGDQIFERIQKRVDGECSAGISRKTQPKLCIRYFK